jgi:hypothetical protein
MASWFLPLVLLALAACEPDADADKTDAGAVDAGFDASAVDGGFDGGPDLATCPDADGDGFPSAACGGADCDDTDAARFPGATEICDADDEDCDPTTFGPDRDRDGFEYAGCCNGPGLCGSDCDDTRPAINPTGVESCNLVDDDCDGEIDEALTAVACFDGDGDARGPVDVTRVGCTVPIGAVTTCNDCADVDASRFVGQTEACNMVDDDCDGAVDEGCACTTGTSRPCGREVGVCVVGEQRCLAGQWESACGGGVFPGPELCNRLDDDCDGSIDEDVTYTFFADCDRDGYGDPLRAREACDRMLGLPPDCPGGFWSMTGEDCDDADDAVNPTSGCGPTTDGGVAMDAGAAMDAGVDAGAPDAGGARFRFVDMNVVEDTRTGLLWQSNDSGAVAFSVAQTYCESAGLPGTGWRLPTASEFVALIDFEGRDPIDTTFFPISMGDMPSYWTSTLFRTPDFTGVRIVYANTGDVAGSCTDVCPHKTRCVRTP